MMNNVATFAHQFENEVGVCVALAWTSVPYWCCREMGMSWWRPNWIIMIVGCTPGEGKLKKSLITYRTLGWRRVCVPHASSHWLTIPLLRHTKQKYQKNVAEHAGWG